jgi:hypothetical protein
MKGNMIRSGLLNKTVAWLRGGYSTEAGQFGHVALVALCPAPAGAVGPSARA